MSPPLFIGTMPDNFDPADVVDITHLTSDDTPDPTETYPNGTLLRRWDFISLLTPETLRPSTLLPLRRDSDHLADDCAEALGLKAGVDAWVALQEALKAEVVDERVSRFWEHVKEGPGLGVASVPSQVGHEKPIEDGVYKPASPGSRNGIDQQGRKVEPSLSEGQAVFWRYSTQIFTALMHFSLAGGFSSPNLSAVLNETGYLTSASRQATYFRLLETTLMVLDVMSDMTPLTGRGFRSAVRVRLLHAQVRLRIKNRRGKLKTYDEAKAGIPINQADLAAVLGSFMIAPIWSLRRCGIDLSMHERASYQAAWRHVGFYLGVSPSLLIEFYGSTPPHAEASFASIAFSHFPHTPPSDPYTTPTYKILQAVSGRPPRGTTVSHHIAYARRLLGSSLGDTLALPQATLKDRMDVSVDIYFGRALLGFGKRWRAGWETERVALFREIVELLVVWGLGERRTVFAWREEESWEKKLGRDEGDAPGITMGPAVGRQVKRRWIKLVGEMVLVVGVAVGLGVAGSMKVWRMVK